MDPRLFALKEELDELRERHKAVLQEYGLDVRTIEISSGVILGSEAGKVATDGSRT